jgi:molecular chaperone HscB
MLEKDYFSLFEINPHFLVDTSLIRKKYLQLSKQFHPDLSELEDNKNVELISEHINKAYSVLCSPYLLLQYFLEYKGLYSSQSPSVLPKEFLMEMMETNDDIEIAKENNKEGFLEEILSQIELKLEETYEKAKNIALKEDFESEGNLLVLTELNQIISYLSKLLARHTK